MAEHVFIDGVGDVRLVDGVIRMNLVSLKPSEGESESSLELTQQLVMSPPAFLRMVRALGQSVASLQEKGFLSVPEVVSEPTPVASPNFK